ncbi:MAG: hypothetical protein ACYCSR_08360 [Thiomonas sp.]
MNPNILSKPWIPALGFAAAILLAALMSGQAHAAGMPAETTAQAATMQPTTYNAAKSGASAPDKAGEKADKMKKEGEKKE